MSFLIFFKKLCDCYHNNQNVVDFIKRVKKNNILKTDPYDALYMIQQNLPNKNIILFKKMTLKNLLYIEDSKILNGYELQERKKKIVQVLIKEPWNNLVYGLIQSEKDKKSIVYILLFLLNVVTEAKTHQSEYFDEIIKALEKTKNLKLIMNQNQQMSTGVSTGFKEVMNLELRNMYASIEELQNHPYPFNTTFCTKIYNIFKKHYTVNLIQGRITYSWIYSKYDKMFHRHNYGLLKKKLYWIQQDKSLKNLGSLKALYNTPGKFSMISIFHQKEYLLKKFYMFDDLNYPSFMSNKDIKLGLETIKNDELNKFVLLMSNSYKISLVKIIKKLIIWNEETKMMILNEGKLDKNDNKDVINKIIGSIFKKGKVKPFDKKLKDSYLDKLENQNIRALFVIKYANEIEMIYSKIRKKKISDKKNYQHILEQLIHWIVHAFKNENYFKNTVTGRDRYTDTIDFFLEEHKRDRDLFRSIFDIQEGELSKKKIKRSVPKKKMKRAEKELFKEECLTEYEKKWRTIFTTSTAKRCFTNSVAQKKFYNY
jgi:hypothetical protein